MINPTLKKIIKELEEMQEQTDKFIKDNDEASKVWQMFGNLVYKLEDIQDEQENNYPSQIYSKALLIGLWTIPKVQQKVEYNMELQVTIKNHYGKDFIYPHCKQSEVFAILTGKKTLTENDVHWIKTLGYTFKIIERTL